MPLPAAKQAVLRPSAAAAGIRGAALSALELEDSRPLLSGKLASRSTDSKEPSSKTARTSRRAWAACAALVAVYLSAYLVGLQGGSHSRDLAFINAHLNAIGRSIVVAIAAFTAALWATRLVGSAAWTARGALAAVHVLLLVVDHGQDFQYHGFYNWCAPVHCGVAGFGDCAAMQMPTDMPAGGGPTDEPPASPSNRRHAAGCCSSSSPLPSTWRCWACSSGTLQ